MVTSQTEEKDKAEAEAKAKAEAAEAKSEPEAEAKVETEKKAEGEEKAKTKTEAKPETEAVEKNPDKSGEAETKGEEKVETEADAKAEGEGETETKPEAEAAEEKDKPEAEAKVEAEEKAWTGPEAKPETEAAEEPKAEAEKKAKPEVEAKPEAEAVEETDKPEAKTEAEEKTETEEKTTAPDQSQESAKGGVSETIQKMTQSPAVLPGESGKTTIAHISVPSTICAKDVMQKDVAWAGPEESVQQALTKMQQHDSSYIIVGQDGALEGIVSKSDITGATSIYLRPIFAKWHGPGDDATLQIKLKWIMSRPVRTIRPEAPLATIIENMYRFGGRGLPVADEQGKVQGLVTVFDIFRTLLNTSEDVSAVGKTAEAPALE